MMQDNWYHHWVAGATLNNQLWHQALVMDHILESLHGSEQGPNNAMMWTLLRWGVIDPSVVDKPWNGSAQSMRYLAMLVGRLWGLLAGERTWVSLHPLCQGITPSNSKGGLPAPEAGARAEKGGIRDEIDPSPSQSKSSQDKAEPQAVGLTQPPRESREERTRRPH